MVANLNSRGVIHLITSQVKAKVFFRVYRFRFLWSRDNPLEEGDDIFTDQSDFGGSLLRVTAVPYAHHVQARAIPPDREDWGEGIQYEAHYGYEIEMMEEARRVLNFECAVTNPPDQGWGIIQEDYRDEQKNLAKFSDTCSVRADGLSIGSTRFVGGRKAGN